MQWSCAASECGKRARPAGVAIRLLAMAAHDAAARADAGVEHRLHDRALVARRPAGARSSSASCCAPRPARAAAPSPAMSREQLRDSASASARRARDDLRQALQLLAADRRLDVGHAVVEADDRVRLEDHLRWRRGARCRARSCRAGAAGGTCASQSALAVVIMPPSPVLITLRGWNEKQATSPCGLPIFSHWPSQQDLAADGAGRVLDHAAGRARCAIAHDAPPGRRACPSGARTGSRACAAVIAASISAGIDVEGRRARRRRRPASRRSSGWRWRSRCTSG